LSNLPPYAKIGSFLRATSEEETALKINPAWNVVWCFRITPKSIKKTLSFF
jgi:hypothetical protein